LSSVEVAIPLRKVLRRQRTTRVVLGEVTAIDVAARTVKVEGLPSGGTLELPYDTLAVSGGSRYSYFGHDQWASHAAELKTLGVTPLLRTAVVGIDETSIEIEPRGGERERVPARTKVWAAGVAANPLAELVAKATGAELDRQGRIVVEPDLTVPGQRDLFAFGDMVTVRGQELPGVAPVAMQQCRHVARSIRKKSRTPFRYTDKGELATIGRSRAVGTVKGVPITGFVAWALWLGIHIVYLIGF